MARILTGSHTSKKTGGVYNYSVSWTEEAGFVRWNALFELDGHQSADSGEIARQPHADTHALIKAAMERWAEMH